MIIWKELCIITFPLSLYILLTQSNWKERHSKHCRLCRLMSEDAEQGVLSDSTLFASYPAILDISTGCKIYVLK